MSSVTTMVSSFAPLYKKVSQNKMRVWKIYVVNETPHVSYYTEHGFVDGKLIKGEPTIVQDGKNVGKTNETTPLEQALFEAKQKWTQRQTKDQYKLWDDMTLPTHEVNFRPMLANTYKKTNSNKIKMFMVQPKLDGVRCNASQNGITGNIKLLSRTGKELYNMNHIRQSLCSLKLPSHLILDGELGCFGLDPKLTFQQVCGLVKRKKTSSTDPEEHHLTYVLYDIYDTTNPSMPFRERWKLLLDILKKNPLQPLHVFHCMQGPQHDKQEKQEKQSQFLESGIVHTHDDIENAHAECVRLGYEGLMIRNPDGVYVQDKRSNHLFKYKAFTDSEFEIVGYKSGKGQDAETLIFTCKLQNGHSFDVRPTGTHKERSVMLAHADSYIGKHLTVKYFEMTDNGVPRFPVGIGVRNYE